jgi:hypothetical protein
MHIASFVYGLAIRIGFGLFEIDWQTTLGAVDLKGI